MAARKHTVILALEQDVNVTLDLTYDAEAEAPYTVNISVLNTAGEKYTLSGTPAVSAPEEPAAAPAATRTTARTRKAG